MTRQLDVLINLIKKGNGDKDAKTGLEGIELATKEAEISIKALDRRYSQLIGEVAKGNKTVSQAQREYRDFARELGVTERASQDAGFSFTELNQAVELGKTAFEAFARGVEITYDTLNDGAQIQATTNTFESLATSIGETSDELEGRLQDATNGAVTNMDLMRFANQAMGQELVTNADQAARLATVATQLSLRFRGNTEAANEFLLLIANKSRQRFDTFGLAVDGVDQNLAMLQERFPGMSEDAAFLEAVLLQGESTLSKFADSGVNTAEELAKLETTVVDTGDALKREFAEGLTPTIKALNDLATGAENAGFNFDAFLDGLSSGIQGALSGGVNTLERLLNIVLALDNLDQFDLTSIRNGQNLTAGLGDEFERLARIGNEQLGPMTREQAEAARALTETNSDLADSTADVIEEIETETRVINGLTFEVDASTGRIVNLNRQLLAAARISRRELNPAIRESTSYFEDEAFASGEAGGAIGTLTQQALEAGDAIDYMSVRQEVLNDALLRSEEATAAYNSTLGGYFVEASRAGDETLTASEQLYELAAAGDLGIDALRTLSVELGIMSAAEAEAYFQSALLRANMDDLIEAVRNGELAAEDADLALEALTSGFADTAAEAIAAAEAANGFGSAIADIPDVTVKKLIFEISQNGEVTGVASASDPTGPTITRHDGGPVSAGQPYLVGDGPGGSYIPGATELFIPNQSGHVVSNRQVERALQSINNSNNRSFTDNSSLTVNLRAGRRSVREAKRLKHRRVSRNLGRLNG